MAWLVYVVVTYGLLVFFGGIEGFLASKSIPSLAAGIIFGLCLLGSAGFAKGNPKIGFGAAAVLTFLLLGFFLPRYMKGHAVWPALVMTVASVLVLICLIVGHFMNKQQA